MTKLTTLATGAFAAGLLLSFASPRASASEAAGFYSSAGVAAAFGFEGLSLYRVPHTGAGRPTELVPSDYDRAGDFAIYVFRPEQRVRGIRILVQVRGGLPQRLLRLSNIVVSYSPSARSSVKVLAAVERLRRR